MFLRLKACQHPSPPRVWLTPGYIRHNVVTKRFGTQRLQLAFGSNSEVVWVSITREHRGFRSGENYIHLGRYVRGLESNQAPTLSQNGRVFNHHSLVPLSRAETTKSISPNDEDINLDKRGGGVRIEPRHIIATIPPPPFSSDVRTYNEQGLCNFTIYSFETAKRNPFVSHNATNSLSISPKLTTPGAGGVTMPANAHLHGLVWIISIRGSENTGARVKLPTCRSKTKPGRLFSIIISSLQSNSYHADATHNQGYTKDLACCC